MLQHLMSYSLEDFIPIDVATYLRLVERVNESLWPLHILTIAAGILIIVLTRSGYERFVWLLLSSGWIFSGIYFHGNFLVELNWAAIYFSWGFIIQGLLCFLLFLLMTYHTNHHSAQKKSGLLECVGSLVMVIGVIGYPLLPFLFNDGWRLSETFAIFPEPTCLVTLGVILYSKRTTWWLLLIPVVWCVITGITAYVFQLVGGFFVLIVGLFSLILIFWEKYFRRTLLNSNG